jgi:hypothetical protein
MRVLRSPAALLIVTASGAAILTRLLLLVFPEAPGTAALGVHIHHLLIGILLICVGGIPAVLLRSQGTLKSLAVAVFGVGIGLALDEWLLFVIRETAPDAPYMTPWSVAGAAIFVGVVIVYTFVVGRFAAARSAHDAG